MSKRGENIYKRKDNRWEARYVKGHDAEGRIQYGYCYGKTYREAKEKQQKARLEARAHPADKGTKPKNFGAYCDDWLKFNRSKIKESTYVKYENTLKKHIKPCLGGYAVGQLSSARIEQFSYDLLNEKHLSPKSVKDILILVKSILKYMEKHGVQGLEPIEINYPKEVKKEMRVLSKEEQTKFMQYLLTDMDDCKFGVLLALLTGLRIGEICALRYADISFDEMSIKISSTMQRLRDVEGADGHRTKIIISEPKSDHSRRVIPLTTYAAKLCLSRAAKSAPEAFVLTGNTEKFMEPRCLQYKLKKYTGECGLEDVHFHVLRHTFATRCVEGGFEIKSLSEVLGHASPKITLERYVHSSLELKRENMEKISSLTY